VGALAPEMDELEESRHVSAGQRCGLGMATTIHQE
jgi:hypothetical protein